MFKSERSRFEIFDEETPRLILLSYIYALNMVQATFQLIGDGFKVKDQYSIIKKSASHQQQPKQVLVLWHPAEGSSRKRCEALF